MTEQQQSQLQYQEHMYVSLPGRHRQSVFMENLEINYVSVVILCIYIKPYK